MNRLIFATLSLFLVGTAGAQESAKTLTLDSCRALAMRYNKEIRMADGKRQVAHYERKVAATKYLPRISATGTYQYTSREFSLLSDEQKETLRNLGTSVGQAMPALQGMAPALNGVGNTLVEALHTDTRNMGAVAVMLTQPLYLGGKIRVYNRIASYAEQVAVRQQELTRQELIVQVDEAFWQIVSLQSKKQLAESYLKLVQQLDGDVQQMIGEGLATKADGLSVKVKVNEARVALIQVDHGLSLSQMLLCQLCGLDLSTPLQLEEELTVATGTEQSPVSIDVEEAMNRRPELNMLALSTHIYREKIRLTRSEYLPTVALTGGYLATNPSVFNSFERQMKGIWNVGVLVNIPLLTSGERIFKVHAARAEATIARLKEEETREKVELQVNQNRQKVVEATERLQTARRSCEEADENLRYANLGLQEGVIPLSNVLEAQTAWLKSHSEQVTARIDLQLAHLYLRKSTGQLTLDPNY